MSMRFSKRKNKTKKIQYTGTALTCEGFVKGTGIQSKAQKRFPRLQKIVMFLSESIPRNHIRTVGLYGKMWRC